MKIKQLKVGVIGVGHIANLFHLPAWKKNKFCKVVSICDTSQKQLIKVSKKFKVKSTYNDLEKMLKNEKLDILSISTSPYLHYKNIILGAKYGCNILVEKPFVLNKIESRKVFKVLKKRKVKCMCAMHQRFRPISTSIKKIIEKKIIGKIYYIKILRKQFRSIPAHSYVFSNKKMSGGGPLIDIGSHYFDFVCWLLNFPKIHSLKVNNFDNLSKLNINDKKSLPFNKFNSEEFSTGLINFKNNITVNFEMSYLLNTSENVSKIEIYGEKGSIIWPKGEIFLINKNGFFKKSKIKLDNNFKASETQINSFVNHVRGKGKLLVKLSESEYIVDLIDYLYKSAKNKKEINYEKK